MLNVARGFVMKIRESNDPDERKARRSSSQTNHRAKFKSNATKVAKSLKVMYNKIVLTAAIIATAIATVCVAAQGMANAANSELLLKLMAFISLIIFDVYALVAMLKDSNRN